MSLIAAPLFLRQVVLLPALLLCLTVAQAEMSEWTDANGVVHFSSSRSEPDVIMYSRAACGWCKQARKYFRDRNIAFSEYDIDKSTKRKREFDAHRASGTPLILIGQDVIQGFNRPAIEAALQRTQR